MSRVSYSSTVGSIMYAMVCTCPYISLAISVVGHYMANPVVNLILWYLRGTIDVDLVYGRGSGIGSNIIGYVNLDYTGDLDKMIISDKFCFYSLKVSL